MIREPLPDQETYVELDDVFKLRIWDTRDGAWLEAKDQLRGMRYRVWKIGYLQLEIWPPEEEGYFLLTYSEMNMIEDIEWKRTVQPQH